MALETKEPLILPPAPKGGMFSGVQSLYNAYVEKRESLGLSYPGTIDSISREVQRDVFLNNLNFSGLRADITKAFSVTPLFQISHALSMGSQGLPPYGFTALFGNSKVFLQGNIDNDLALNGRFNYRWTPSLITKTSVALSPGAGQDMLQIENDYVGRDSSINIKAMNPSIIDGGVTGIFIGSFLQSVTPALSLGLEAMWQRAAVTHGPESNISYALRYKGDGWIASAQVLSSALQGAYWRRLTDKVEVGADITLQFAGLGPASGMMGGLRSEGVATLGAKYDFRQSVVRTQVDSTGRVATLLETRIAPAVQLTFSGEIDHSKNAAKVGLAVSLEAAGDEVLEQQEAAMDAPPIPF